MLARSVSFTPLGPAALGRMAVGAAALLMGCLALSLVIAAVFVLTPNAIAYEGLLLVPVFIASGIVVTSTVPPWLALLRRFLPLSVPFDLLLGREVGASALIGWCACAAAWFALSSLLGRRALRLATRAGSLEVI